MKGREERQDAMSWEEARRVERMSIFGRAVDQIDPRAGRRL